MGTANNIAWFSGGGFTGKNVPECALYIKTTNPIIREKDSALVTGLRRLGYNRLFSRADKILTLSDAESRILALEFPNNAERFRSVFNPYVTEAILSLELAGRSNADTPFNILTLGRFSPQKNMARLIAAFALAKKRDLEPGGKRMAAATLTIAGEGPELEARKADAARLGLSDQVNFPGFTHDVSGLLADADLYVLSSNYEGLPAVVLEALGSGCPVVSTDCFPAARELLSGLAGCVVTERSAESLADGILAAIAVKPDRPALRARAANYSVDSAVQSHLKAMGLKAS
jgi:glycosyltransferase involved in cell wall biosynthesis